jgi:hypothetical protein
MCAATTRLEDRFMKRVMLQVALLCLACSVAGCKSQQSDADAIRSGINAHLAGLKTLNISAMDMNVQSVSIQGTQAQAQVEFRPKTGGPQGAGMQVSYALEKKDGQWTVLNSQPAGGTIEHPGPGQNPHAAQTAPDSATLPDFRNLVNGTGGAGSSLPPGHPPVNAQGSAPSQ